MAIIITNFFGMSSQMGGGECSKFRIQLDNYAQDWEEFSTLEGHIKDVWAVSFSHDGKLLRTINIK